MGWFKSVKKAVRKTYDALTDSRSKVGKIGKYAFPFNAPYLTRDAWRKYGKKYIGSGFYGSGSSSSFNVSGSSASQLANTGFRSYR